MKPAWNSLLPVSKTLSFSFFLLLSAMPIAIAEPLPSAPETPQSTTPPKPLIQQTTAPETPAETTPNQKLIEADRLYRQGQQSEAEALYRAVKDPFTQKIRDRG